MKKNLIVIVLLVCIYMSNTIVIAEQNNPETVYNELENTWHEKR